MTTNMNTPKSQIYNKVLLTCAFEKNINDTDKKYRPYKCVDPENYLEVLQGISCPLEYIGLPNQQIKPCVDIEYTIDKLTKYDKFAIQSDLLKYSNNLQEALKLPNGNDIVDIQRPIRPCDKDPNKLKVSYHLIVDNRRISQSLLKVILENAGLLNNMPFDGSIYGNGRGLHPVYSKYKRDKKTNQRVEVPQLVPYDMWKGVLELEESCDISACCASYIEEDFEDLDKKFGYLLPKEEEKKEKPTTQAIKVDNNESEEFQNISLDELICHLNQERAKDRDSWINGMWAIMNCCDAKGIKTKGTYELCDKFSARCESAYDADGVYDWFHKNYDKRRDCGYRFKYLFDWLKEDDPEYYRKLFTPKKQILPYLQQKEIFEQDHAKILYPIMYAYRPNDKNKKMELMCPKLLKETYSHLRCLIKKQTPKGVEFDQEVSFINKWTEDPNIKLYDYMEFLPPPARIPMDTYNTWIPFSIFDVAYDKNNTTYNEEILTRFMEYGNGLLGEEVFRYMLAYFANRLQNPAIRNGVCIVLYGVEGDGKNMFFDIFKNIFGLKYFHELEKAHDLFSAHSYWEVGRLFICVNEADPKDTKSNAEVMKARITTETVNANPKGVNMFTSKNYCDYIMTTNNDDAMSINNHSRRYLICQSSAKYRRDGVFFGNLRNDIVKNDTALRVIAEYLMNFNVAEVIPTGNFQNHMPQTDIMNEVIEFSMDYVERFLRECNDIRFKIADNKIKTDDIFTSWRAWCENSNINSKMDKPTFSKKLNKLIRENGWDFIKKDDNHKVRGYYMYKEKYMKFVGLEFKDE